MAPLPPALGVAKVTFNQTCSGRGFGDSLFFWHTDSSLWSVAELMALATGANAFYDATILALQDSVIIHSSTDATDFSDLAGRTASVLSGVGGGAVGTNPLPLNVVMHIALEVNRRYRGGRPGYNISGLDRVLLADERSWTSAEVTAVKTEFDAMTSGIAGSAGLGAATHLVGVSYHAAGVVRPVPLIEDPVTSEPQQRVCSLRKRLGKSITL